MKRRKYEENKRLEKINPTCAVSITREVVIEMTGDITREIVCDFMSCSVWSCDCGAATNKESNLENTEFYSIALSLMCIWTSAYCGISRSEWFSVCLLVASSIHLQLVVRTLARSSITIATTALWSMWQLVCIYCSTYKKTVNDVMYLKLYSPL